MPQYLSRAATACTGAAADEPADAELLAAVAGGDRAALAVLYRRHAPLLLVRLRRRCADAGLVEEVLQDTFVAVWTGAGGYAGNGAVPAWMWGIASRRLVDALRRAPRPSTSLDAMPWEHAAVGSAEDDALVSLEHGPLGDALRRLSPPLREVVQATVLDGLTTAEAARRIGVPAGTVKTRMMRARTSLRRDLVESR